MLKNSLLAVAALAVTLFAVGCSSQSDDSEDTGSTTSNLEGNFPQDQVRMVQTRRLLKDAAALVTDSDKLSLINQAISDVNQGINFDDTHLSADEDESDGTADVTVANALAQCGSNVDCLLTDADQDLQGATHDKGGFRVQAMSLIEQALQLSDDDDDDSTTTGQ